MYAEGLGVPQGPVLAYMWSSLAAAQGQQEAGKTLAMAEQRMTPAQIAEAQKLAPRLEAGYAASTTLAGR